MVDKSIVTLSDASCGADVKLTFVGAEDADKKNDMARIRENVKEAKEKADEKQRNNLLSKIATARDLINSIGDHVKDLHPALAVFNAALQRFTDACEKRQKAWEAAGELTDEFETLLSITGRVDVLKERHESRIALESMLQLIAAITDYICNHVETVTDFLITQEYTAKIDDFRGKFKEAFKWFELCVALEVFKGVHILEHDSKLKELRPSLTAHYRTGEDHVCLKDTRTDLLKDIMDWLRHFKSLPLDHQDDVEERHDVFWLHGLAGSGKSSVANTIAATVEQEEFYLSCFFCKRDDPELSDPTKILPTLAYRIAQQHGGYRTALVDVLSRGSVGAGIITGDLHKQFKTLFEDLVTKVESPPRAQVIVIDALDECGKPNDQRQLSRYLLSLAGLVPWIKVFITSRPEPTITDILEPAPSCEARDINVEEYTTSDIRLYTQTKIKSMDMDKIPGFRDDDIDRLVDQAGGLFIWCATFFKYMADSKNRKRDLRQFFSGASKMKPLQRLYALYDQILDGASDPEHQEDTRLLRVILGLIFITADNKPLSARALCTFLQSDAQCADEDEDSVRNATRSLHAVLYEDHASGDAVRAYHPSFLDFLRDRIESGVAGWVGIDQLQRLAFKSCFLTLNEELKFNICRLESSSSLNKNIQNLPETISAHVSESLQYSSQFWSSHLQGATTKEDDEGVKASVAKFLKSTKVFFWLEVLSLLNAVGWGIMMLREIRELFKDDPDISSAASDLERFVLLYSEAFESAPHIYRSALAWLPEKSQTLDMAKSSDSFSHLHMITDKEQHWEAARWVKNVNAEVLSVAYSPNGCYIAAGLDNSTVCIWDSRTSEAVHQPLTGHGARVGSVVFSPDNQLLASGSAGTIRIWNVATGATITTMGGHSGDIGYIAIAFLPDRQQIASASFEIGVQIWDINTGRMIAGPWLGRLVWTVAFSPDGERIVINSIHDRKASAAIRNVRTGEPIGNPLKGEVGIVQSVAWSRNGGCVASGTVDGLVHNWNAQSGEAIGQALKAHTATVNSIAFSPDSTQVASGSADGSIRLWDVMTGRELCTPLKDHGGPVRSVTFSPDGGSILSGSSDGTIRIWDVDTAAMTDEPSQLEVRSDYVCVAFSPDGQYFASGSQDGSVCIWNAITGTAQCEPFRVYSHSVDWIVFSLDSRSIVTASGLFRDKTIEVWDSRTGAKLVRPILVPDGVVSVGFCPEGWRIVSHKHGVVYVWDGEKGVEIKRYIGHASSVTSASLFPDGGRVVSGSYDKTLRIWDINAGEMIGEPLTGHRDFVDVVAVSLDGQHIASGSRDMDVRIWDAHTHGTIHVLQGHTSSITSISFSADGQYIVSGSYDRTIRIWNVETGQAVGHPLRGHSNGIKSVAFSPDSQRVVSCARDDAIRMWDTQIGAATVEDLSASTDEQKQNSDESRYRHWNACCSQMEVTDGWVKDGDKLLLWIPQRYREHFERRVHFSIGAKPRSIKPEVDLACLYGYTGKQWTGMYKV
ncbi:WD40 repeat-like protein [Pluteus cervinus]|uniref:WD40 repeat-like protein n=1 Tax=Pluteus cervinus TaxID=181527 RepID=A0ACD3AK22_9AGAR|nr:WD40 repeat-like protein [Pluteus cervinus]